MAGRAIQRHLPHSRIAIFAVEPRYSMTAYTFR
jgi:hypothetical protein